MGIHVFFVGVVCGVVELHCVFLIIGFVIFHTTFISARVVYLKETHFCMIQYSSAASSS